MRQNTVESELEFTMVLTAERRITVPTRLTYRGDDPYAVRITFHTGSPQPVCWTFARELLVEGVHGPCGHGDVRIWPTAVDGAPVVLLALSSPEGEALLEAPAGSLATWLERTLDAVPPGAEDGQRGLDDTLAGVLARATGDGP
ncbi:MULTISPECIES: SsgA family sporulation/cell division regulator [Streptomyces]|uniref:SsgA family sporulation/cell division regulator n=1 Tax=Streptomyces lichenis TaxID=2306967 RepID=A0ABT0I5Q4_9ACTN|nr:SsgA family sporulation/cell division regulator [Streptomyces lichenis]MCK8676659.1 SsgA family sporulation/cell division regulator [Streptomyces lichenis]